MVILYHHNSDYANKIDLTPSWFFVYLEDEEAAGIRAGQPSAVRFQALSSLSMSNRQLLNVVSSTDL